MVGARAGAVVALLLAAGAVATGCASAGVGGAEGVGGVAWSAFAPELDVEPSRLERAGSGLWIEELEEGEGPRAVPGVEVAVHYTVWLPDGTVVDRRLPPADPLVFELGEGRLVRGWEEGVEGMRPGARRRLVVAPGWGYGRAGLPGRVPPDTPLVFEVERVTPGM